jgi:hypothetical protein
MDVRHLIGCLVLGAAIVLAAQAAEEERVQHLEAPVTEKPMRMSKVVGTLKYGARVNVLEAPNAAWRRIETLAGDKITGWMRASALAKKDELHVDATGVPADVTGPELLKAGKGVNPQVEHAYVNQNGLQSELAQLDALERNPLFKVTPEQERAFLAEGHITPKDGQSP